MTENHMKFAPLTREEVKTLEIIADVQRSKTQTIRVALVEVRGKRKISLAKWWRENPTDEWTEGKGFHMGFKETGSIIEGLQEALKRL